MIWFPNSTLWCGRSHISSRTILLPSGFVGHAKILETPAKPGLSQISRNQSYSTVSLFREELCVNTAKPSMHRLLCCIQQLISVPLSSSDMVKLTKAKTFQAYLDSCHRRYSCVHCRAHLANHDDLISKVNMLQGFAVRLAFLVACTPLNSSYID